MCFSKNSILLALGVNGVFRPARFMTSSIFQPSTRSGSSLQLCAARLRQISRQELRDRMIARKCILRDDLFLHGISGLMNFTKQRTQSGPILFSFFRRHTIGEGSQPLPGPMSPRCSIALTVLRLADRGAHFFIIFIFQPPENWAAAERISFKLASVLDVRQQVLFRRGEFRQEISGFLLRHFSRPFAGSLISRFR